MDATSIESCIRRCLVVARNRNEKLIIVHGGARGADMICDRVCRELGVERIIVNPDWGRYGSRAGFLRNQQMLDENTDIERAYAFSLNDSSGTRDMIIRARRSGIPVYVNQG